MPGRLTVAERFERMDVNVALHIILRRALDIAWREWRRGDNLHPLKVLEDSFLTDDGDITQEKMIDWADRALRGNDQSVQRLHTVDWNRLHKDVEDAIHYYHHMQQASELAGALAAVRG